MKFTKEHEWVNVEGGIATIGITDYAQKHLGDIVSLDLPRPGAKLIQFKELGMVDSMKASSPIYAPISGEVIEPNKDAIASPQLVNESPEERGWLVKVKPGDEGELDKLMDEPTYRKFVEGL